MARYIDADAWGEFYKERTHDLEPYNHYDMGYGDAMYHVDDWIDAQPTIEARPVDAVEVVRCKDCIRWMKDVAGCTDFVGRCAYANHMIGATGYCLYGERKEKGDDRD